MYKNGQEVSEIIYGMNGVYGRAVIWMGTERMSN
jgi:hypothetical protein